MDHHKQAEDEARVNIIKFNAPSWDEVLHAVTNIISKNLILSAELLSRRLMREF